MYFSKFKNLRDTEWERMWLESVKSPERHPTLPNLPDAALQKRLHGTANEVAMRGALKFRKFIKSELKKVESWEDLRLLDFGCGWGRHLCVFLKDIRTENLYGTDVDEDVVSVARRLLSDIKISSNEKTPPTEFTDDYFDVVISNSVFSHLSEEQFNAWTVELARIITPGGYLIFTTWGKGLLAISKKLFIDGAVEYPWQENILKGFTSYEHMRDAYLSGRFVYAATGGGNMYLPKENFGIALISLEYARRTLGKYFSIINYIDDPDVFPQAIFFSRRDIP